VHLPSWAEAYGLLVGCRSAATHLALYVTVMAGVMLLRVGQPGAEDAPARLAAYTVIAALLAGALWRFRAKWESSSARLRIHVLASLAAIAALTVLSEVTVERGPGTWLVVSAILLTGTLAFIRAPAAAAQFVVLVGSGWMLLTGTAGWLVSLLVVLTGATVHRLAGRQAHLFQRSVTETKKREERALAAEAVIKSFEESGNNWLWRTAADGSLTYASPRFAAILEKDVAELLGRDLVSVLREGVCSTEQHSAFRTLEFSMAARLPLKEIVLAVNVDGNERWFSIAGTALIDEGGRYVGYSGVGADLTAARQAEDHARKLALFDSLTGLANRAHFHSLLDELLARSAHKFRACTLMYIDLDRFKVVNDTLGHPVGDELLRQVARRIDHVIQGKGQAGRLGGDEFVVILPDSPGEAISTSTASRLIEELSAPYRIGGSQIQIGASVGLANGPDDGARGEDLIRHADLALYAAKQAGRGTYRFYDKVMGASAEFRRSLEMDLRLALTNGQLGLAYQPFFDLNRNSLVGFEALLRWSHPTRGDVPPEQFISVAEESGLIARVGEWALRTALREAANWPEHIAIAVNLSPLQLQDGGFAALMMSALAESQINPSRVELEVTEGVFLQETPTTQHNLDQLKAMGLRLALDDFGTGYSSLGYLRKVEFSKIKIDRSFVEGIQDQNCDNVAIVRAVVALADSLGMSTTAEGAETLDQINTLRAIGCSHVQGFAYGGPMIFEEASSLVFNYSTSQTGVVLEPRDPRVALYRRVVVRSAKMECAGTLRNVSAGGAMIEVERPLPLGSAVELRIQALWRATGTIQWIAERRVGVMFDKQIDIEQLNSLNLDQRRTTRVG
jgi:diguanylate cyclase (GGDEF)-like protein